ncbi:hypothetical protein [Vibrio gazogenes]|uniref:Uncharacterized protein n=1 Tax=Vibrio gazogenes DSM 21264 = NBRC 103151 TaxID=1123492 RepID=A0A1M5F9B5_VIBGA|nr:hypothetical protein [Vibrio gazogenes]USP15465.1 hypothetical protein MKS89_18880 [Vibrio gazogenes]SHF88200.1 hypothetical protein SAMN02745781_03405 [Vibrio gazogenes DSM 21264] [Vibrio gazogenes DSM 21264 = NBRC 103151]SJN54543.1 hypothetical protein BQ6471_01068 [Vibrio gazogenes]
MTKQVDVDATGWVLISSGKTRGVLENNTGSAMKVRVEDVGVVPPDSEKWGHNLPLGKVFIWEKQSSAVDVYARLVNGDGVAIVTEG